MATKTTKRRKVWVFGDSDGHHAFSFDPPTKKATSYWTRAKRTCRTYVEARPGDVVLSREQADLICRRLNDLYDVTVQDKHEIRALLRGRR